MTLWQMSRTFKRIVPKSWIEKFGKEWVMVGSTGTLTHKGHMAAISCSNSWPGNAKHSTEVVSEIVE